MRLLTILLLISIGGAAQTFTPSPGNNITVTIGGSQFKVKAPFDYATCDSTKLYFHVFFCGDGETTATSTENTVMGKWIKSGGPWNSHVLLNNGDTARVIVMSIPAYGNQPLLYGNAIKTAIQSCTRLGTGIGGTTPIPGHFSMGSLSGGVGRIASWQNNDTTQVRTLFKRGLFMSGPVITSSFGWSSGGNWFVGWSRNDNPSGGTPPSASVGFYTNLQGTKDSLSFGGSLCGHCNNLWDSIATVHGLNSHTGGTALTNRIRRLIDPTDGLTPGNTPPSANAGSDQQITLPTNSVTVNGSASFDTDGTITTFAWTKISGPSTFTITSPSSASTTITDLVAGTYVFRLTVTDDDAATAFDDVTITVNNPPVLNYIVGQLFQKTHSGETFLVYLPDTAQRVTLKQHFVFSMSDSSGKDSAYITSRALGKKIINGWDGKQPLTNGDTAVFNIVILMSNPMQKNSMETIIQWALDSIPNQCFDTANRTRNIMSGIGQAAERMSLYLLNEFVNAGQIGTLKFRHNFGKYTSIDHRDNGRLGSNNWDEIRQTFKSWWIAGGSNSYPYNTSYSKRGYDSARVYNSIDSITKYKIISGPAYSSVTWDSVYSSVGTGAENNMFRWWADDIEFGFPGDKIPVGRYHYADLSGADGLAAKNTFYYLDSEWDIKTGATNTVDTTDGRTYAKSAIMHRRFGQRDIWVNFQKPFIVTAVYGKRRNASTEYPDTVTFYSRGSRINNLTFLAADKRTRDDYWFRAISIGNSTAWDKLWEGKDTTQYFLINLRRNTYTEPFTQGTDGNYQDFVFYGYELPGGVAETKYNVASETQLDDWINNTPKETLANHSGANFSNIYMVNDYDHLKVIRGYNNQWHHFDSLYPGNKMNMNGLRPDSTGWVTHNLQVKARGTRFNYVTVNGTNPWVMNVQSKRLYDSESPLWGSDSFKPTDSIGQDPAIPSNYKTFVNNLTTMAELFGHNTVKNVKLRTKGDFNRPNPGQYQVFDGIEVGNEDDIDVHDSAYMTPLERAAKWSAMWDGHKGTMNTGDSIEFGIHIADPTMKVITDATVGWNWKPLGAAIICAKIIRGEDSLPFNMVATHLYHSNTKVNPGVPSSITNIDAHGIPPEMFGYPDDIDTMARGIRRYANKGPEIFTMTNNEWGWDKTYQRPKCSSGCDTNFFNTTSYGLPRNNIGMDSSKWHSVLLMRGTAIFAASHYNQSVVFTFNDDDDPQDPGLIFPYSFSGLNGYYYRNPSTFNVDSVEYTAAAFHYRGMLNRFKDYYVENVIDKTSGGRWVMQWKSSINSDTLMYMVWEGDSTQAGVSYDVPVASGKLIKEWVPSTTDVNGSEVMRSPTGGTYTANAGIEPRFFLVYSDSEPENQSPTADAGSNQSITLPTSQVTVNGSSSSDPDGTINTYLWTKMSGPATFTITNPNNASTTITGLVAGTYVFRLTVTDDDGAQDTDDVQITVEAAPVVPGNRRQYFRGNLRVNKFKNL